MASAKDREEMEAKEAFDRANSYAVTWLNDIFRFRDNPSRFLFTGVRLGLLDYVWMVIVLLFSLLLLVGLPSVLGLTDIFIFSPIITVTLSVILAWFLGRRVAHISPLRRQTGEGTGVWLGQKIKRTVSTTKASMGAGESYNTVSSWVNGELVDVPAREWLGSMPAPRSPSYSSEDGNETAYVELVPRGEQGIWR